MSKMLTTFFIIAGLSWTMIESASIKKFDVGQWICKGRPHGDQIPHPEDCHSYFVCDRDIPKLVVCGDYLHYDNNQKVCNWPDFANCRLGEYPLYWESSPRPIISTVFPDFEIPKVSTMNPEIMTAETKEHQRSTTITTTTQGCNTQTPTTPAETKEHQRSTSIPSTTKGCNTQTPPYYTTTAIVKPSNSTIGPIDENGRNIDPMKNYNPKKVQCLHNGVYFLPHPGNCQKYFICANHILYLHSCGIFANWNYKAERCDYQEFAQCYFDEKNDNAKVTTKSIKIDTITDSSLKPKCLSKEQNFIAHSEDCTKYYICIDGEAALMKCPEALWWSELTDSCSKPEDGYCKAALKM